MAFAVPANSNFDNNDGVIDIIPRDQPYNSGQVKGSSFGGVAKSAAQAAALAAVSERIGPIVYEATNKAIDMTGEGAKRVGKAVSDKFKNKGGNRRGKGKGNGQPPNNEGNGRGGSKGYNNRGSRGGGGGPISVVSGASSRSGIDSLSFDSKIPAGLTVNRRLQKDDATPLYLSSGWLFKVTDPDIEAEETEFELELRKVIYPVYEQIISNTINRWVGQYTSADEFLEYFQAVSQALQIFYCIDSILAYSSNNTLDNINYGMEYLRNQLTAQVMVDYNLLKETLENSTIPPNLIEFIRWFCQNYRTSDAPHASIIRLNIGGMYDSNWNSSTYTKISELLRSARENILDVSKMMQYLHRAFPSWTVGTLPPSVKLANFDKDFFTFWHNQNCCFKALAADTSFSYTHLMDGFDSYLDYQILERDEDVDGAIFATASCFYQKEKKTIATSWGIWQPLAETNDKDIPVGDQTETFNIKYISDTGKPLALYDEIIAGRSGIHWMAKWTNNPPTRVISRKQFGTHGFIDLQNVNPRMQAEAFGNTVRLLMDPPRIR